MLRDYCSIIHHAPSLYGILVVGDGLTAKECKEPSPYFKLSSGFRCGGDSTAVSDNS
jgi:hypothetical protein